MLVLSRNPEEAIMIGDEVEITVLEVRGDKVRLGIRAPAEIPVHRKEVYEAMKRANVEAASPNESALKQAMLILRGRRKDSKKEKDQGGVGNHGYQNK